MLEPFAHEASVDLRLGEPEALGAAVTLALCGALDHDGPCPLAPHFSRTERVGARVLVRVLFVTEREREGEVRSLIDAALDRGSVATPHGGAEWILVETSPSAVAEGERDHAIRLAGST
jgi:hypothetical protein